MELFAMGDYGPYVWSCYLLTLIVVVISTVQGKRRHQQISDQVTRQLKLKEPGE